MPTNGHTNTLRSRLLLGSNRTLASNCTLTSNRTLTYGLVYSLHPTAPFLLTLSIAAFCVRVGLLAGAGAGAPTKRTFILGQHYWSLENYMPVLGTLT